MKNLLSRFRDPELALKLIDKIHKKASKHCVIMEICGGQTHAIVRGGLDQLLPNNVELVHGPGCPVCVTALELIDQAIEIASLPNVIFTSYGDMLRVPGSNKDLTTVRAEGGDIRVVYSPLDAVILAKTNPDKEVVFFGIGFETTAPANAMSVIQAKKMGVKNFSLLASQVRVPPAMKAILESPENRIQGFLAAGHVCTIMGYWEYIPIATKYSVPIIVTGFEINDLLLGILEAVRMLEIGKAEVKNAYSRVVTIEGNKHAQETIHEVYRNCDRNWRGIGMIPDSGWCLQDAYQDFDAQIRYKVSGIKPIESPVCIAGQILQGHKKPTDCSAFAGICTPEHPLGATMVSSEGACSAYFQYSKN